MLMLMLTITEKAYTPGMTISSMIFGYCDKGRSTLFAVFFSVLDSRVYIIRDIFFLFLSGKASTKRFPRWLENNDLFLFNFGVICK